MAEAAENVKETEVSQQGDKQVVREKTSSTSTEETRTTAANGIWFVVGLLEILLIFRFILKLLGANPASGFVNFIYDVSHIFVAPFTNIFSTPTAQGDVVKAVFETGTIVAIIVYALIGWGLVKLINLNKQ